MQMSAWNGAPKRSWLSNFPRCKGRQDLNLSIWGQKEYFWPSLRSTWGMGVKYNGDERNHQESMLEQIQIVDSSFLTNCYIYLN